MSDPAHPRPRLGFGFWAFIALMLVLTALWVGLGVWQVQRLQWKEALIAEVATRLTAPPYGMPSSADWPTLDPDAFDFHPVKVSGQYAQAGTVLVFTSLDQPKGRYSGAGYWVMTPFAVDGGGTVFINRGFVPQASATAFIDDKTVPKGHVFVTGIMIAADAAGPFTTVPDRPNHIDWIRDPARLAALDGLSGPVFPMTIDLPAGPAGALPQAGETIVDFPNNHLGYALTWFGLALLTPALLAYWVWRQLSPKAKA
jgi:surfeit locus 1 family protein